MDIHALLYGMMSVTSQTVLCVLFCPAGFPRIDPILCICTAYLHWSIIGILLYLSFCIYTAGMQVDRLWMNAMSSALAQALLCYICDESMLCARVGGT